ncbi:MAG TPA: hypothetical protein PKA13_17250 [Geminicoccaceae bacterium]|nr:hypothetical protein [Geminicoccus sp.]HMU51524.1 hypothetical protein [Geminicoccaceae bacterium]
MTQALVVAVLLALLAATGMVSWWVWQELADVEIGMHGWIALCLGVGATLLLGVLLVTLMHLSAKRGFDDDAGKE